MSLNDKYVLYCGMINDLFQKPMQLFQRYAILYVITRLRMFMQN